MNVDEIIERADRAVTTASIATRWPEEPMVYEAANFWWKSFLDAAFELETIAVASAPRRVYEP